MQRIDDLALVFSPSDLVGALACGHLPELELAALEGLVKRPDSRTRRRWRSFVSAASEHERRYLSDLETAPGRAAITRIAMDDSVE